MNTSKEFMKHFSRLSLQEKRNIVDLAMYSLKHKYNPDTCPVQKALGEGYERSLLQFYCEDDYPIREVFDNRLKVLKVIRDVLLK